MAKTKCSSYGFIVFTEIKKNPSYGYYCEISSQQITDKTTQTNIRDALQRIEFDILKRKRRNVLSLVINSSDKLFYLVDFYGFINVHGVSIKMKKIVYSKGIK